MTLAEMIADAESQYHLLVTGQAASVFVDQNGERIEYVRANAARLQQYINRLKDQLAAESGTSRYIGPGRVFF